MFKAKLNFKFYIVALVLLGVVLLGWYGIYFLQTQEILMENGEPMEATTKVVFTVLEPVFPTFPLSTVLVSVFTGTPSVTVSRFIDSNILSAPNFF